jgi:hypothetical protein
MKIPPSLKIYISIISFNIAQVKGIFIKKSHSRLNEDLKRAVGQRRKARTPQKSPTKHKSRRKIGGSSHIKSDFILNFTS